MPEEGRQTTSKHVRGIDEGPLNEANTHTDEWNNQSIDIRDYQNGLTIFTEAGSFYKMAMHDSRVNKMSQTRYHFLEPKTLKESITRNPTVV